MVVAWNEVEEAKTSLESLSLEEIKHCKNTIIDRLEKALYWLGKYVNDEDVLKEI